jgi:WD40 repeat protein
MNKLLFSIAIFAILLSACGPVTAIPSVTPTATATVVPATPTPAIAVTHPELEPITPENVGRLKQIDRWGEGTLYGMAISPDQKTIVVYTASRKFLLDSHTLNETRTAPPPKYGGHYPLSGGFDSYRQEVAYSPDGKHIAFADGFEISIWDAGLNQLENRIRLWVPDLEPSSIKFSPNGKYLVVYSRGGNSPCDGVAANIALYTVKGDLVLSRYTCHPMFMYTTHFFTSDGKIYLLLYSYGTYENVLYVIDINSDSPSEISIHPIGGYIVGNVSPDGSLLLTDEYQHGKYITKIVSFPNLEVLATVEGSIEFVPSGDGKYTWKVRVDKDGEEVLPCGIDPSRYTLLSSDSERAVVGFPSGYSRILTSSLQLWDLASCTQLKTLTFPNYRSPVFSPDGAMLAVEDFANRTISFVDTDAGSVLFSISKSRNDSWLGHAGFIPDGSLAYVVEEQNDRGTYHYDISIWDTRAEKLLYTLVRNGDGLLTIVAGREEPIVYVQDHTGLKAWNIETGKSIWSISNINNFALSADGKRISAISGNSILLLDSKTGARLQTIEGIYVTYGSVFPNRDGSRVVASRRIEPNGRGGFVTINTSDKTAVQSALFGYWAADIVNSPLGDYFVADTDYGYLYLADYEHPDITRVIFGFSKNWGVEDREPMFPDVFLHYVGFSPDGKLLVTVLQNEIRIWDVQSGLLVGVLEPDYHVEDITFSPDGRMIAVAGDGDIRIWGVLK